MSGRRGRGSKQRWSSYLFSVALRFEDVRVLIVGTSGVDPRHLLHHMPQPVDTGPAGAQDTYNMCHGWNDSP